MRRSMSTAVFVGGVGAGHCGAGRRSGNGRGQRAAEAGSDGGEDRQLHVSGRRTLTVPVGTTVTWTNRDDIPHTVVSTDKVFKSKVLDTDEKFSFTFSKPGTYHVLLLDSPEDDRQSRGAVRAMVNPFDSGRCCSRSTRSTWC